MNRLKALKPSSGKKDGGGQSSSSNPAPPPAYGVHQVPDAHRNAAIQIVNYMHDDLDYWCNLRDNAGLYKHLGQNDAPLCHLPKSEVISNLRHAPAILEVMSMYGIPMDSVNVTRGKLSALKTTIGFSGLDLIKTCPYKFSIALDNDRRLYDIMTDTRGHQEEYDHFLHTFSMAYDLAIRTGKQIDIYPLYHNDGGPIILTKEKLGGMNIMTWLRLQLRMYCKGDHAMSQEMNTTWSKKGMTPEGFYNVDSTGESWLGAYHKIMENIGKTQYLPLLSLNFTALHSMEDPYRHVRRHDDPTTQSFFTSAGNRLADVQNNGKYGDICLRDSIVHLSRGECDAFEEIDNHRMIGHAWDTNQLPAIEMQKFSMSGMSKASMFTRGHALAKCFLPMDPIIDGLDEKRQPKIKSTKRKPMMGLNLTSAVAQPGNFWNALLLVDYPDKKPHTDREQYYNMVASTLGMHLHGPVDPRSMQPAYNVGHKEGDFQTQLEHAWHTPEWHTEMASRMRKAFELPKDVNQYSTQRLQFDQNNMKERELLLREGHMMQAIPHEIPLHFNNPHAYGPHITPEFHEQRAEVLRMHHERQGEVQKQVQEFHQFQRDHKDMPRGHWVFNGYPHSAPVWSNTPHPKVGFIPFHANVPSHPAYLGIAPEMDVNKYYDAAIAQYNAKLKDGRKLTRCSKEICRY